MTGRGIRRRRKEGRTGGRETPMISARHGYAQKHASGCYSIHSVLTCWSEGLRVVGRAMREPEEGGTSCC